MAKGGETAEDVVNALPVEVVASHPQAVRVLAGANFIFALL